MRNAIVPALILAAVVASAQAADSVFGYINTTGITDSGSLTVLGAGQIAGGVIGARSATYTLAASDCGTKIRDTSTSAHTYTVPAGLQIGCQVDVIQAGSGGAITFVAASGVTLEQFGAGTLTHATSGQFAKATILIDGASTVLLGGQVQ